MKIQTSRFGEIEVTEDMLLTFPAGVIGFSDSTRYVILEHDRPAPFRWMQSVDEPDLAFAIADPADVQPDYEVTVKAEDLGDLGSPGDADLLLFVILTVRSADPSDMTANLRGPIVANVSARRAKQLVLSDELPTRAPLFLQLASPLVQSEPALAVAAQAR